MSQLVALRVTLYLVYVEPRVVWIMGNLPLQVVDPFSERLATLAWKKLDHKQNQNTIDIILFIIITTCFYFDQENDSHKTQSSIMIFLYMLYMFMYPLFWYFDISDILIKKEKHTIYHVLQISSLLICIHSQRCGFHNTNDTFDTCMHRLICGWGDNITTCITLDLFEYIYILLKKIERLFKAPKWTAKSRIYLKKSSAIH